MTFVVEVFVKCFELYGTHSMSINFCARCASRITHKPKRKEEKKTAKKKKKESHYFKVVWIGMTRLFGNKYYLTDNYSVYCIMVDEVEIYLQKYILALQPKPKPPYLCFLFYFLGFKGFIK